MAYRNKTYVCFDADNDIRWYRLMQAWNENGSVAFDFHNAHEINRIRDGSSEATIKGKLALRLHNTKVLVVLIGGSTKDLYKYVRWEIEYAIDHDVPIVAVNLNKKSGLDRSLCPPLLRDELAVHIPYSQKGIDHALNQWPSAHRMAKTTGAGGAHSY